MLSNFSRIVGTCFQKVRACNKNLLAGHKNKNMPVGPEKEKQNAISSQRSGCKL